MTHCSTRDRLLRARVSFQPTPVRLFRENPPQRWRRALYCFLGTTLLLSACTQPGPPFSPQEALETFVLEEDFRIEIFAAEPLIQDPVAMEIDEQGRVYVVEMIGYPLDTGRTGRVKLLEDSDGDGVPDRSTVFADGLMLPTGVLRWKNGVLVTDAPDVWYLEDTDGDNRADVKTAVLTGFALSNPQHTVSNPCYGLDNWIYLAHEPPIKTVIFQEKFGDEGSKIRFAGRENGVHLENRIGNLRFRPGTHELEAVSGSSGFGLSFDRWGRLLTLNSVRHIRQQVLAAPYLSRNPALGAASTSKDISDHPPRVYPVTLNPKHRILTDIGNFTSSCGIAVYSGGLFPSPYDHASFVADPAHNLVHCDLLKDGGVTLQASRVQEETEFLASTDHWFRPVFVYVGPDGALYVVDYYRRIIEHPEWMSDEFHDPGRGPEALYEGGRHGRIYRITPESENPTPWKPGLALGRASDLELAESLNHPNAWRRTHAQRMLVDRQSRESVDHLREMSGSSPSPDARLHALWTLEGLGGLTPHDIRQALKDPEPGIRENAIRLAESRLDQEPSLARDLLAMTEDGHPRVRFQLLCTLGWLDSPATRRARRQLLLRDMEDPWVQLGALSASAPRPLDLLKLAVSEFSESTSKQRVEFFRRIGALVGAAGNPVEIRRLFGQVTMPGEPDSDWWRAASLEGLAQGIRQRSGDGPVQVISTTRLLELAEASSPLLRSAALRLLDLAPKPLSPVGETLPDRVLARIGDRALAPALRADSVRLLALLDGKSRFDLLAGLLDPQEPEQVQVAAVRALEQAESDAVGTLLISKWREMTTDVRLGAAATLLSNPETVEFLLTSIESEDVPFWTVSQRHKSRLVMHADPSIRARVHDQMRKLESRRLAALERFEAALDVAGDPVQGGAVFEKNCEKCHEIEGTDAGFGPDLGPVRHRSRQELLADIMLPSRSIADNYQLYVVELNNGVLQEGVIATQTPVSVILRREDGSETVIPRENIRAMFVSSVSGMPEGLEEEISVTEMGHLLSFLTGPARD